VHSLKGELILRDSPFDPVADLSFLHPRCDEPASPGVEVASG